MLNEVCRENLISAAKVYAKETGASLEQVSAKIYGNRVFLRDYERNKKTVSLKQYDKMWKILLQLWPEGKGKEFPFTRSVVFQRPK